VPQQIAVKLREDKMPDTLQTQPQKVKKTKKKHGFFYNFIKTLIIIILIIVIPLAGFLIYAALDGADPAEHIPQNFYAYINLPSAGGFLQKSVSVQTLDALLAGKNTEKLQGNLRSLRASPVLSAAWFKKASNFRVDAAFYENNNYLLCAKLGFRSAPARLLPAVLKYRADLLSSVKELSAENRNGILFWIYKISADQNAYIGFYKDLMIVSASEDLFIQAFQKQTDTEHKESVKAIKKFIKNSRSEAFSILTDMNYFTAQIKGDTLYSRVVSQLNFPEHTAVNFDLNKKEMSVSGSCSWDSEDVGLKTVLQNKSAVPGILARLPESTDYITLIKMGEPTFLFENGAALLGRNIMRAYENAASGVRFLFQKDIQELIFSWMGDEIGIAGTADSDAPLFFISLKDEQQCRDVFSHVFSLFFVQQDVSAVVNGLRIPRIEFPDIIKALTRSFGIELSTPFYVIQDGYLYLSESAEVLATLVKEVKEGRLLVKTENWKTIARSVSPETSLFAYYTLDNRVPAFLKHNAALRSVLKDYGKGVVSVKLDPSQKMNFELYMQKTASVSRGELAAFPYDCAMKVQSRIYCGKNAQNIPFAYWTSGNSVYALNLAQRSVQSIKLDDTAYLNVHTERGTVKAVWAVSARGTVYKTDYELNAQTGFPVLTGERCAAAPQIVNGTIVVPLTDKNLLLFVDSAAGVHYSDEMDTKLKKAPFVLGNNIAAFPRSFDSCVYLFDAEGKIAQNYPIEWDAISAVQPVLYKDANSKLHMAILTEEGVFSLMPADVPPAAQGQPETLSVNLNAACKVQPVYSAGLKMFFVATEQGDLYKIDTQCRIIDKVSLKPKNAQNRLITLMDFDMDGSDDIFVSGGGNAVYAYSENLLPLDGFPVSGSGAPCLIDVDGDGKAELVCCGIDNKIHAYIGAVQ